MAEELKGSDILRLAMRSDPRLFGEMVAQYFRFLDINDVAMLLKRSAQTVRRNEDLMQLAFDVPDIGKRWDGAEVQAWVRSHARCVRVREVKIS